MKLVTITLNPAIDVTLRCERINRDDVNRVVSETREAGGKGINVSRMAKSFGIETVSTGIAARESADEFFSLLSDTAGELRFVRVRGKIRENITISAGEECLKFNRTGCPVNGEALAAFYDVLLETLDQSDLVALSGSLPPGAGKDVLYDITRVTAVKEARLLLDTENCTLSDMLTIKPYFIKPNIHEFSKLYGGQEMDMRQRKEKLRALYQNGVQNAFLTLGAQGMIAMLSGRIFRVSAPPITPKSTVGAGDSTLSAFACAKILGYDNQRLLRFASACGAATAASEGSGLARPQTVGEYLDQVEITEME